MNGLSFWIGVMTGTGVMVVGMVVIGVRELYRERHAVPDPRSDAERFEHLVQQIGAITRSLETVATRVSSAPRA